MMQKIDVRLVPGTPMINMLQYLFGAKSLQCRLLILGRLGFLHVADPIEICVFSKVEHLFALLHLLIIWHQLTR